MVELPAATALVTGNIIGVGAFAMWMVASAGETSVYQGQVALLAGIPAYIGMKAARRGPASTAAGIPMPTVAQKTT